MGRHNHSLALPTSYPENLMSYETILYTVDDRVAVLTLNRPERMNSFNLKIGRAHV